MAKRESLGRGLGALIPKTEKTDPDRSGVSQIPIDRIDRNPDQPRKRFDEDQLKTLSDSIAQHGVIQPLVLAQQGDRFVVLAGERRWRAAGRAGLKAVPAVIREGSDPAFRLELAMIENLQRADLDAIEEAEGFRTLMDQHGYTQDAVSQRLGKSRSAVANSLRLLGLDERIRKMIAEGSLTAGHGRALVAVEDKNAALEAAKEIVRGGLSVRDAERLAADLKEKSQPKLDKRTPSAEEEKLTTHYRSLEKSIRRETGWKIRVRPKSDSSGKLEIVYGTLDEFDNIVQRLKSKADKT